MPEGERYAAYTLSGTCSKPHVCHVSRDEIATSMVTVMCIVEMIVAELSICSAYQSRMLKGMLNMKMR